LSSIETFWAGIADQFVSQVIEQNKRKYWWVNEICHRHYGRGAMVFTIRNDFTDLEYATLDLLDKIGVGGKVPIIRSLRSFEYVIICPDVFVCEVISWFSDSVVLMYTYLGSFLDDDYKPPRLIEPFGMNQWKHYTVRNVDERKQS
jgi:hypothetical protein